MMQLGQFPGMLPQAIFSVGPNVYQQGLPLVQPHLNPMSNSQLPAPMDMQASLGG